MILFLHLHFVFRSLEKEISFDFGTAAEFSYLYNQCYEMHTGEYVHILTFWKKMPCIYFFIIGYKFLLVKD